MDGPTTKSAAFALLGAAASLFAVEVALFTKRTRSWFELRENRSKLVTEKLELERALSASRATAEQWARHAEHNNRLATLGTTLAKVAHEINNSLTFIVLNLSRLGQLLPEAGAVLGASTRNEILGAITDLEEGAGRIQSLSQELKAFSSREIGATARVHLEEVVSASLRMLIGALPPSACVLQEHAPGPRVRASRVRLMQIVINLVRNAIEASPPEASCVVRVSTGATPGGGAYLRVEDDGPGVSDELKAKIFDPFFTTRPDRGGTGLGLSICREIVSELGGTIEVRSRPGETVFEVVLPPDESRPPPPGGLSSAPKSP